jgi:hypothetical protein
MRRFFLQDITIFFCLTLPIGAVWAVQKRMADERRQRQEVAHSPGPEHAPEFNGMPFANLKLNEVQSGRAVDTFTTLVSRQERELGCDDPETLSSRNNLANALMAEGRHREAEAAQRELLIDMERALDRCHPDVFRCRFNLALNLRGQGRNEAARIEMEKVYEGWRAVLGESHPRTQVARLVLDDLRPVFSLTR